MDMGKTIDEVIDILEHPLYGADEGFAEIAEDDIADALHYLREYLAEKDSLANARALTKEAYEKHINWIENCKREYERMIEQGCEFQQAKEEYEAQTSEMRWVNKHFAFEEPNDPLTWDKGE